MQVFDTLASVLTDVGDDAITSGEACGRRDVRDGLHDARDTRAVFARYLVERRDVRLGYDQDVYGCLRIDVRECIDGVIFIDFATRDFSRDDFTEQAVFHYIPP